MEAEFICVYVNELGAGSVQALKTVKQFEGKDYIQGWAINHEAPRTLRIERIIKTFDSIDDAETFLLKWKDAFPEIIPTYTNVKQEERLEVCFTGFKKSEKTELTELASSSDLKVRQEVTKFLDVLCYGYNAGPKKLEKALQQGVMILNRNQFENLIETGEVPEDV